MTVITRFAPSPTGTLHIGGVRTALFNYVYAKQNKGLFLIRIEDTDQERSKKEYEKNILDSLNDLGLKPDNEPVHQSKRTDLYTKAANSLIESGKAYYCNCSKERLDEMRTAQQKAGLKPQYDGQCRDLNLPKSDNTVLRLKTPLTGQVVVKDFIRGEIIFENSELDDLILLRSNGSPTYHLCNVIDDYDQEVTTVIRGEDHISNTPRQIHIQEALDYPSLEYAHLPLVLGEDKKRLSKRHAATSLDEYKEMGYLDVSIINTLARLGWSKGDNEVFNLEDLIRDFKINDVQKAGAVFDLTKLDWVNTQHLSKLDPTTFKKTLIPFIDKLKFDYSQYDQMDELIEAMRSVKPNLSLIAEALKPYLDNFNNYDEKGVKKFLIGSEEVLNRVKMLIESLNNWNEAEISKGLEAIQAELDLSTPKMNQPVRIALTGSTQSPSLSLTIKLIGRSKSIKLLDNALTYLSKN
jgi:glutamyl-tRNA synthetase